MSRTAVWVAVAFVFVLVAALPVASTATATCRGCHAMRAYASALADTSHKGVSCASCHGPSVVGRVGLAFRVAFVMAPRAVSGETSVTSPSSPLPRNACVSCHAKVLDGVITAQGLSIEHRRCAKDRSCETCHGESSHPGATRWTRLPVMEECVRCHTKASATVACDVCHAGKGTRDRLIKGPWQVTHGSNWKQAHGMGSLDYCATCHPSDYCTDCHGISLPHSASWGETHGEAAKKVRAKCVTCHPSETLCVDCHGMEMPHPPSFLKQHSKLAKSAKDERCLHCHADDDCVQCHANHIHPGNAKVSVGGDGE